MFTSPRLRKKIEAEKAIAKKPFLTYMGFYRYRCPSSKNYTTAQACGDCLLGSAVPVALAQLCGHGPGVMQEAVYP